MANGTARKGEILPNPDPSALTTEQLDKAISNLESRVMARIDGIEKAVETFHEDMVRVPTLLDRSTLGLRELLEMRLVCMENDIKGVHVFLDTRGKDIAEQITHLRDLAIGKIDLVAEKVNRLDEVSDEKFSGIDKQFQERDKRTEQLSLADKTAIAAALQAQKEAAGATNESNTTAQNKMETNFAKLIDQTQTLVMEVRRNTDDKINDLKSRLDKGEGRTSGVTESDVARARNSGMIVGLVGMGLAIATLALLAFRVVT